MSWLRSITAGSPLVGFVLALVLGFTSDRATAAGDVCELQLSAADLVWWLDSVTVEG